MRRAALTMAAALAIATIARAEDGDTRFGFMLAQVTATEEGAEARVAVDAAPAVAAVKKRGIIGAIFGGISGAFKRGFSVVQEHPYLTAALVGAMLVGENNDWFQDRSSGGPSSDAGAVVLENVEINAPFSITINKGGTTHTSELTSGSRTRFDSPDGE